LSLSPAFLDELRLRTTLSALVGKSVKLQRAGREFRACCPFHDEKTPSFYVNDEKGFYHCFGCGAHGDAIRFLTDNRGLPFMDAVKELAEAAGLELPAPDRQARERAERAATLHDVTERAQGWFAEQLDGIGGAEARAYLDRRGIGAAQRRLFGFGWAPDARGRLRAALADIGDDRLVEAGLLIRPEEAGREPYDRFRGRVTLPIRDGRGRVIGFGGRVIGEGEPKYLNSPETPLFDKGRTLFNLDRAAPAARKAGRVVVVEGYMDVVALAGIGIEEAVAPLGTALTEQQLERLWRMADAPILCFDGDKAGQKAAVRAAVRAMPGVAPGRTLRFALLPAGQDPDDLARAGGAAALDEVLGGAIPLVELLWRHERDALPLDTPEARAGLKQRLDGLAALAGDREVSHQYREEFRRRLSAHLAPARREWRPPAGAARDRRGRWPAPAPSPASGAARAIGAAGVVPMVAEAILRGLVRRPDLIAVHAEALAALPLAPGLARLRDVMLDAAFRQEELEPVVLDAIFAEAGLGGSAAALRNANGLGFSFTRADDDPERAARELGQALDAVIARPELEAAFAAATARLALECDEEALAEQGRLRLACAAADRALWALVGDGEAAAAN
jgi:DNA primase